MPPVCFEPMIPDFGRYETMHALKLYIGYRDRYIRLTIKAEFHARHCKARNATVPV
jgi:hypothetical protein